MATRDPWAVLGVPEGTPYEEARQAFRRRARATHPDHGGDPAAFTELVRAFEAVRRADPPAPRVHRAPGPATTTVDTTHRGARDRHGVPTAPGGPADPARRRRRSVWSWRSAPATDGAATPAATAGATGPTATGPTAPAPGRNEPAPPATPPVAGPPEEVRAFADVLDEVIARQRSRQPA